MMAKNIPARNMTAHVAAVAPARHRAVVVKILWKIVFITSLLENIVQAAWPVSH